MINRPVAVFMDLDDTLTDRAAAFAHWAVDFLRDHGLPRSALPSLVEFDDQGRRPREEFFAGVSSLLDLRINESEELAKYRSATSHPPAFAGVEDGLAVLSSLGAELMVLSNGVTEVQLAKLSSTGLLGWFDRVVISDQVGAEKPDTKIYHYAQGLARPESECWMVGDHPVNDIHGARAAGFRTAWVSHGRDDQIAAEADVVGTTTRQCLQQLAQRCGH
jgi:putative hydrolase of the HAD superfamily